MRLLQLSKMSDCNPKGCPIAVQAYMRPPTGPDTRGFPGENAQAPASCHEPPYRQRRSTFVAANSSGARYSRSPFHTLQTAARLKFLRNTGTTEVQQHSRGTDSVRPRQFRTPANSAAEPRQRLFPYIGSVNEAFLRYGINRFVSLAY